MRTAEEIYEEIQVERTMKEPELDQFMRDSQAIAAFDAIDFGYHDNPQIDKVLQVLNTTDPDLLREAFAKWFDSSACSPSLAEDVFKDLDLLLENRFLKECHRAAKNL